MHEASFEAFYAAEHPRVLGTVVLLTGDLDLAREATDEAFARTLERWARVSAMARPGAWTVTVARNCARRNGRRRTLERRLLGRQVFPTEVPGPAGELWSVVAQLPQRQREVIVLRYLAHLTELEVGRALGISRSTVSSTLIDARNRLQHLLNDPAQGGTHG